MERQPESNAPAALAAIAVLLLAILAGLYVTGYLALSDSPHNGPVLYRTYKAEWLATIYSPEAYAESIVTGKEVETAYWSWSEGD